MKIPLWVEEVKIKAFKEAKKKKKEAIWMEYRENEDYSNL